MKNLLRKSYARPVAIAAALVSAPLCACDADSAATPRAAQAGDQWIGEYGVGDHVVERTTYRLHDLETDGQEPALVLIAEGTEIVDPSVQMPATEHIDINEVHAFLRDEWDAYIGGSDDAGVDAQAFIDTANDMGLDLPTFMRSYRASGKSLDAFISSAPATGTTPTLGEEDGGGYAKAGVEVLQLAWDIIKDAKPVTNVDGASTAVLNVNDLNPLDYTGAQHFEADKQWWTVKNTFDVVETSASWHVKGTYGAVNAGYAGHYLPSVYVDFDNVTATIGNTLDGTCEISNVSNTGTLAAPEPEIDVVVKLKSGNYITSDSKSFTTTLRGSTGPKN